MTTAVKYEEVPISRIVFHPDNPNKVPDDKLEKIRKHIQETGLYQTVTLRSLENSVRFAGDHAAGRLQMIDGEHRVKVLRDLGWKTVRAEIWPGISDMRAAILVATLDPLSGEHDAAKRQALIKSIASEGDLDVAELASILPEGSEELAKIMELAQEAMSGGTGEGGGPSVKDQAYFGVFMDIEHEGAVRDACNEWLKVHDPNGRLVNGMGHALYALVCRE